MMKLYITLILVIGLYGMSAWSAEEATQRIENLKKRS